ncbi:DNA double-strand break repair protein Mre11 [Gracilaria domingensis]|nr:DNA double-strand break repair protein Mre11 [Gracilaria domingensis]
MPKKAPQGRQVIANPDPDSLIKVLISTDNHLGYLEKDPIRGDDSFRAFEEVLELANANDVDMVLLGGDLFHDNKPSRSTIVKTMKILRRACLSPEGEVKIAVRSDVSAVNYMNPSMAVSLPVFVIHGNHDDPTGGTGLEALSALDLLSEAGLVTYFGKMSTSKKIDVRPILLQKGETGLALYGLGNIRDEVLYDTWARQRNVKWHSPEHGPQSPSANELNDKDAMRWFNLFVLHQNRLTRGSSRGISETLLPPWLDYVVWGHEHDSLPELTLTDPPVVQPGSTVATSLTNGESKPKHCILLELYQGRLKHRPVPLYTVRNFEFEDIALSEQEELSETDPEGLKSFLSTKITELVERQVAAFDVKLSSFQTGTAFDSVNGVKYPPRAWYIKKLTDTVRRPLIRLRVEITGNWDPPNPQRFGQDFVGKAASPNDILLFYRHKRRPLKRSAAFLQGRQGMSDENAVEDGDENDGLDLSQDGNTSSQNIMQIPRLTQYYLYHHRAGGSGLKFLELDTLTGAVDQFVHKAENKAIGDYVDSYLKVQQDKTLEEAMDADKSINEEEMAKRFQTAAAAAATRVLTSGENDRRPAASKGAVGREGRTGSSRTRTSAGTRSPQGKRNPTDDRNAMIDDQPQASDDDRMQNPEVDRSAFDADLEEVHAMITSVPRLANANEELRKLNERGNDLKDNRTSSAAPRGRATRGRGRGRGRGRSTPRQTARASSSGTRPRRAGRRNVSLAESSENEDDIAPEPARVSFADDEEEYKPLPSSRKRRPTNNAGVSNTRSSARARTESAASVGSRRAPFSNRTRVRRSVSAIDLDEASGDDAM